VINNHIRALKRHKAPLKEKKRLREVYKTVYKHARSKGQSHRAALTYCFNVYTMHAPKHLSKIVKEAQDTMMLIRSKSLKEMIRQELMNMREGDVVNLDAYKKQSELDPETLPTAAFDAFISEMHNQIISFMEESEDELDPDQQSFLEEILDNIEDRLGIENEDGFDDDSFEDEEDV
jgi:hypothetical protein